MVEHVFDALQRTLRNITNAHPGARFLARCFAIEVVIPALREPSEQRHPRPPAVGAPTPTYNPARARTTA